MASSGTASNAATLDNSMIGALAPPSRYAALKAGVDVVLAFAMLVIFAPLILLSMLLVKLTSPGPALYSQERLGRGGRRFTIYKVRSMHHDCERLTGPRWAIANDPRVTPVGAILRATHLDELPQLWNVLRGEMGLIGPRPERPSIAAGLEKALPDYRDRLLVRPGITGLAQVQLPPDEDLTSVRRKLNCDLYYVEKMNPVLDLQILLATATKVLGIPMAVACRVLRIPTEASIIASELQSSDRVAAYPAGFWPSDLDAVSA